MNQAMPIPTYFLKTAMLFVLGSLLMAPESSFAQSASISDSTTATSYPERVHYRSKTESLLSVPGLVLYLPFKGVFYVAEQTSNAIWEKRVLDTFNSWFTTRDGRTGVRLLASTTSGPGIRLFRNRALLDGDASFTTQYGVKFRQDQLLNLDWPDGRLIPGNLTFTGQFRTRTVEKYYGVGNATPAASITDYLQEDGLVQFVYRPPSQGGLSGALDVSYHTLYTEGGQDDSVPNTDAVFSPAQAPGLGNRAHFLSVGVSTQLTNVDVPGSPTRGSLTRLRVGYSHTLDDEALNYASLSAVTEHYTELFAGRTISLKTGTDWRVAPSGSNQIPFYGLASIGGEQVLLGYERSRFRDRGVVHAAVTYKFPIWFYWDGLIFYERGRTLHHPSDFTFSGWKDSIGGGFRLWTREGALLNFLVARSSQQVRIIFNFNSGF